MRNERTDPMTAPLVAHIQVPLQQMLQADDFERLMAYSQRERISPDAAVLRALVAFLPEMERRTLAQPEPVAA